MGDRRARAFVVAVWVVAVAGCYPAAHTYSAKTLDKGEDAITVTAGSAVVPLESDDDPPEESLGFVWATGDIGMNKGLTSSVTGHARVFIGIIFGAEGALTMRLLKLGGLHVAVNGSVAGIAPIIGYDGASYAVGRGILTYDFGNKYTFTVNAGAGAWSLGSPERYYTGSVGVSYPRTGAYGSESATVTIQTVWVEEEDRPGVLFGYTLDLR